ncbi:MAG: ABC transporter permease [Oscillospiraceae bacterium]|nr:ABC transporter permease [Oscillospiraceae bacterium]
MNVIKKLTLASIKNNKKRSIATVIAIILSTALICGVAGICTSTLKSFQNTARFQVGDFHMTIENVKRDELPQITSNNKIEKCFYSQSLGYGVLDGSKNEEKPYVYVYALSKSALSGGWGLYLSEGRMPISENEIVISSHIRSNARVQINVGDEINLSLGKRVDENGNTLFQSDAWDREVNEAIEDTKDYTFTVVGVIYRPDHAIENYLAPGYTCFTYASDEALAAADPVNVSFSLKNARSYDSVRKSLLQNLSSHGNLIVNTELLQYQGALSDSTLQFIFTIGAIVTVIIMVTSVFVIRNSFAISVSEKTKQYGILASVGATSKQIRKAVLFEGLLLGLVGVPMGIASGIIAIFILLNVVNALMSSFISGLTFTYWLHPLLAVASAFLAVVTIFFSAYIPARRAGKIAPIEAVRGNREVNIRKKEIKVSFLTEFLFGIGGVIAAKNLKRSRKKYRTTVISLVLSVTVFISLSSFVGYMKKGVSNMYESMSYNISVFPFDNIHPDQDKLLYPLLADEVKAENCSWFYLNSGYCSLENYGSSEKKRDAKAEFDKVMENYDFSAPDALSEQELRESWEKLDLMVAAYNEEYFEKYIRSLGISSEVNETVILCDLNSNISLPSSNQMEITIYKEKEDGGYLQKNMTVQKTVNSEHPMGLEGYPPSQPIIVVSEKYFSEEEKADTGARISALFINAAEPNEAEAGLLDLINADERFSGMSVHNEISGAEATERVILIAGIFLYGFITVITLIGVTNIFNTITTNMNLRQKEFAMLRSIGMTSREFNRMVRLESMLYGLRSLFIGIPLGILGGAAFYIPMHDEMDISYVFPVMPIIMSAVFVFIIVGLTMRYSLSKINKQNIIETIRNENT